MISNPQGFPHKRFISSIYHVISNPQGFPHKRFISSIYHVISNPQGFPHKRFISSIYHVISNPQGFPHKRFISSIYHVISNPQGFPHKRFISSILISRTFSSIFFLSCLTRSNDNKIFVWLDFLFISDTIFEYLKLHQYLYQYHLMQYVV